MSAYAARNTSELRLAIGFSWPVNTSIGCQQEAAPEIISLKTAPAFPPNRLLSPFDRGSFSFCHYQRGVSFTWTSSAANGQPRIRKYQEASPPCQTIDQWPFAQ